MGLMKLQLEKSSCSFRRADNSEVRFLISFDRQSSEAPNTAITYKQTKEFTLKIVDRAEVSPL